MRNPGSQDGAVTKAAQLYSLRGVGINTAWLYGMEFFSWRTFHNTKQVGSLAELTPTPKDSGKRYREQGIGKDGSRHIRGSAIELAWGWLRFQPDSELTQWYQRRSGSGSKRIRKIGIVALARKLLIALWRFVETGVVPEGAELSGRIAKPPETHSTIFQTEKCVCRIKQSTAGVDSTANIEGRRPRPNANVSGGALGRAMVCFEN